jgi:hypothetical protein
MTVRVFIMDVNQLSEIRLWHGNEIYGLVADEWASLPASGNPEWIKQLKDYGIPQGVLGWAVKQPEGNIMVVLEVLREFAFILIREQGLYNPAPLKALSLIQDKIHQVRDEEIEEAIQIGLDAL